MVLLYCKKCGYEKKITDEQFMNMKMEECPVCVTVYLYAKQLDESVGDNFSVLKGKVVSSNSFIGKSITKDDVDHFKNNLGLVIFVDDLLKEWSVK